MPRKPIGQHAMTDAERQARYRAARAVGTPVIRTQPRQTTAAGPRRWHDAIAEITQLQAQYANWRDALPTNLQDSKLADSLQAICDIDLSELQDSQPPRGFGRP